MPTDSKIFPWQTEFEGSKQGPLRMRDNFKPVAFHATSRLIYFRFTHTVSPLTPPPLHQPKIRRGKKKKKKNQWCNEIEDLKASSRGSVDREGSAMDEPRCTAAGNCSHRQRICHRRRFYSLVSAIPRIHTWSLILQSPRAECLLGSQDYKQA